MFPYDYNKEREDDIIIQIYKLEKDLQLKQ